MLSTILYIIVAIIILLVLITVHEFGHYSAGKLLGFKINEFSIGFGKAIYKKTKKNGEVFSIRLLPLGGYCAFEGEDEDNPSPDAFNNQKPWKRLIVTLSGVLFNFLFAIIMSAIFLMVSGYAVPKVYTVAPGNTRLEVNDIIRGVNGKNLEIYRHLNDEIARFKEGETYTLTIERDGKIIDIEYSNEKYGAFYYVGNFAGIKDDIYDVGGNAISEEDFALLIRGLAVETDAEGKAQLLSTVPMGKFFYKDANGNLVDYGSDDADKKLIELANISLATEGVGAGIVYTSLAQNYGFFESLVKAWPFAFYICSVILSALAGIFTGATGLKDLGGTVTAIGQMAQISAMGFTQFLMLFPLLSLNLAIFNVLPIPALDGARAVFILIEMIFRKPVPRKIEGYIHTVGLILLLALVLFLDIYHIFFVK
ncbi:MAG: site-2 protease family protein [Clostridia bacterium]|nr:site-2 protease family protein [Clostridia bacterium]